MLTSVKKMEDSLKRLKKGRSAEKPPTTHGMTDDDKIRQQLIVDMCYYGDQVSHVVRIKPQPLYNTVCYNMDLHIQISAGSQMIIQGRFPYVTKHFTLIITCFG